MGYTVRKRQQHEIRPDIAEADIEREPGEELAEEARFFEGGLDARVAGRDFVKRVDYAGEVEPEKEGQVVAEVKSVPEGTNGKHQ